jgi:hypothetical protein
MDFLWIVLVIAVVLLVYWLLKSKPSSKATSQTSDAQSPAEDDPIEQLLALNLDIRKAAINKDITTHCETVIDQLIELIPQVNEAAVPGSELIWTVNRIATEYLPNKCVKPYLALNKEQQAVAETVEQVRTNLTTLQHELQAVAELLAKKDQKEFEAKAAFLKHRFSNN